MFPTERREEWMAFRSRSSWSICGLPQSPVPAFFRLCRGVCVPCVLGIGVGIHEWIDTHQPSIPFPQPPKPTQPPTPTPTPTYPPEAPRRSSALSFFRWIATDVFWNSVV